LGDWEDRHRRPAPEFSALNRCAAVEDPQRLDRKGRSHQMARSLHESRTATLGPDRQLWSGMLAHLNRHQPTLCRQWFEELEPLGIDGGVLRLRARSVIHRDYLHRQCVDQFNDAARTISKHLLSVQFLGPDDPLPPVSVSRPAAFQETEIKPVKASLNGSHGAEIGRENGTHPTVPDHHADQRPAAQGGTDMTWRAAPAPEARPAPQPKWDLTGSAQRRDTDSLVINPDYSFDHFVVGPTNRLAHAAAVAVASNPGRAYNPYFVHGGVGLGKTHLLQAICLRITEQNPETRIFYTSCEGFMTQFMDAVQAGEMSAFRHRFRDVDLLIIDDIHFLAKRDRTQEEFFHTFNSLFQQHKQIVLSSDAPPEEIPDLEDRLVSRFKWGLVTSVAPPCYETRVEILKNKARMRGLSMPDDVACLIASRIDANIRELEGAIIKLQVVATVEQRPIDMAMAAQALGAEPMKGERKVEIQTIIATVTEFYGVKMTDLQSKRRQRSIALPRQVCMYLARRNTRFSLEEIGGYFGGRDHTTVMHAVRTIEDKCATEPDFARVTSTLESQIQRTAF
jgi:chromosomal replication initiator protein